MRPFCKTGGHLPAKGTLLKSRDLCAIGHNFTANQKGSSQIPRFITIVTSPDQFTIELIQQKPTPIVTCLILSLTCINYCAQMDI